MNDLEKEIWQMRDRYLGQVRSFFQDRGFLEVTTPIMNPWSTPEPFLHPFFVSSASPPDSRTTAFESSPESKAPAAPSTASLITSPEFNLKILWARLKSDLFEIAHCFRDRESGSHHSAEFLMLEWYWGQDERRTIDLIFELISALSQTLLPGNEQHPPESHPNRRNNPELLIRSVDGLFKENLNIGLTFEELRDECLERGHFQHDKPDVLKDRSYEEFFFTLFLNYVEPALNPRSVTAIHGYPAELAAYATVENHRARRFEIYWKGLELANGYFELRDPAEQRRRMKEEARVKERSTGRKPVLPDQFLQSMEMGLPEGTGVALGLERLLMALTDRSDIRQISPFPSIPDDPG